MNMPSLCCIVGFCASTDSAIDLLQRKMPIPTDLDESIVLLIEEMQRLWEKLKPLHGQTVITPEIYKCYWGCITERTPSTWSKIHFGHWKAIRHSEELTHLTCTQLNLITTTESPPLRWGNGLQFC
jgi:hypothetical protein